MPSKAGDRILFGQYAGSEVTLDGEEYLVMKEDDVLGILGAGNERLSRVNHSCTTSSRSAFVTK